MTSVFLLAICAAGIDVDAHQGALQAQFFLFLFADAHLESISTDFLCFYDFSNDRTNDDQ
jgi:hypothetical protein